jgi:hypothetical protein
MSEPVAVPLWLFLAIAAFALWSLIDRLVYDPHVVEAANVHARANHLPRDVAMAEVHRYAREIVPAFNAYVYSGSAMRSPARSPNYSTACGWASPTSRLRRARRPARRWCSS